MACHISSAEKTRMGASSRIRPESRKYMAVCALRRAVLPAGSVYTRSLVMSTYSLESSVVQKLLISW